MVEIRDHIHTFVFNKTGGVAVDSLDPLIRKTKLYEYILNVVFEPVSEPTRVHAHVAVCRFMRDFVKDHEDL